MTAFTEAPEVAKLVEDLINTEADHSPLADVEIRSVFRDEHQVNKGKAVLAKARLISGINAYLAGEDDDGSRFFVIEVALDTWRALDDHSRRALLDHELCHCKVDPEKDPPQLYLMGHDLEEFTAVVERHGLWRPEITELVQAAGQGRLDFGEDR